MTHTTSHRDFAPGKNNFDSSKFCFSFYLVILAINKVFAVHADQNGPGTAWTDRNHQKILLRFFGTKFESQHKEFASSLLRLFNMYDHHYESFWDRLETLVEIVNLDGDPCTPPSRSNDDVTTFWKNFLTQNYTILNGRFLRFHHQSDKLKLISSFAWEKTPQLERRLRYSSEVWRLWRF